MKARKQMAAAAIGLFLAVLSTGCGNRADQAGTADTEAPVKTESTEALTETESREAQTEGHAETAAAEETEQETASGPATLPEAGEIVKSGAWGSGTYTLDSNGILTLSGEGEMYVQDGQEVPDAGEVFYAVVEEGVTKIGAHLERYPDLRYVSLPSTVTSFRFMDCKKLSTVILSEGITELGNDAFENCQTLTSIELPGTLARMGMRVFTNTGLTEITLPEKMSDIGNAFTYSQIISIEWPDGVSTIDAGTFYSCSELASVTLPRDVTVISDGAFQDCPKLTDIYYEGTEEEFGQITIGEENDALLNAELHYLGSE